MNEKLTRTFFHQLISGLEYLHKNGCAHLDLKLENLLLGNDLELKIADFDSSYQKEDFIIISRGTRNNRPKEIRKGSCKLPQAADIYSAGLVLFQFMFGNLPYLEDSLIEGEDLQEQMETNISKFWNFHSRMHPKMEISKDFK